MSASLVGSEMCIRDRCTRARELGAVVRDYLNKLGFYMVYFLVLGIAVGALRFLAPLAHALDS
eukprot:8466011-Alexandrium_andersonii.AAC.1